MIPRRWRTSVLLIIALASPCAAIAAPADTTALGLLRADADSLRTLVRSPLGRAFLAVTAELPRITPRVVWRDSARTAAWTDAEAGSLPDSLRSRLVSRELDESFYWNTRYGSPLAYVRALELLSENGFRDARGKRVADFGCGMVGQLRLLALLGADATGIDVDPLLRALYTAPRDQGPVTAASGRTGRCGSRSDRGRARRG